MIIEKLMKQADFTDVEKSIAAYLMKNGFDVKNMSIQSLARATFSSPSTITRFCRKLGLDGYKKFQILFYSEYEVFANQGVVDANYPFSGNDSFEQIVRKLAKLNNETIRKTVSGFDYNQLHRIVQRMSRADMINVFSVGTSATVALEFQQKMLRFGKIVNLTMSSCFLPPQPDYSFPSGHTASSFAAVVPAIVNKNTRKIGIAALIVAILMAVSRIYVCALSE